MSNKKKKEAEQYALKEEEIDFYRVQGASFAFIEFLDQSRNYNEIFKMWQWLKIQFEEHDVEDRMIFPIFRNAGELGYDIPTLASKLINSIMAVDWDEIEVGWLQSQFAIVFSIGTTDK